MEVFVILSIDEGDHDSNKVVKVLSSKKLAEKEIKKLKKDPEYGGCYFYFETHDFE